NQRKPGVPIIGEPIHPCSISDGQQVGYGVSWRQRVGLRCAQEMSLIIEGDHAKDIAQARNQRVAQRRIGSPLSYGFSLRPGHRLWIDRQQKSRTFSLDLDLDGTSVMQYRFRHVNSSIIRFMAPSNIGNRTPSVTPG